MKDKKMHRRTTLEALCKRVLIPDFRFLWDEWAEAQGSMSGPGLPLEARGEQKWLNVTNQYFPGKHLISFAVYMSFPQ